jgi:SAM-dependent methyltransferase
MQKDYFSDHSKIYAAFRPTYPAALYDFVFEYVKIFDKAWDCATGNGQVAQHLSQFFAEVQATDISAQQLDAAAQVENIHYSIGNAEQTAFAANTFDLITVGQALHWFEQQKFFAEAKRVGKPGSILAVWGYAALSVDEKIDPIFYHYYHETVGAYWDEARKQVEEEYSNVNFPFDKIISKKFELMVHWSLPQFIGYLQSWSASQKFIKANSFDPTVELVQQLSQYWEQDQIKSVSFPIFLKVCEL